MKTNFLKMLILGLLAIAASSGMRSATRLATPQASSISHMLADTDIGDGTSPTKKG